MPFTKHIPTDQTDHCTSREHDPPSHIVLSPGTHTWKCPACGKETTFYVDPPASLCFCGQVEAILSH